MSFKSYVEFKDSNIEWIGEIPKHWQVYNLKKYFFIHNGSTPKDLEENWGGDICWITPADYKTSDVYINQSSRQITKVGLNSCGTTLVPKGSIIVSNRAPIGTVAIANIDLCTNQGCKSLSIKKDINTKFVYYILSINETELNRLGRGTTFMELSSYDLGTFQIPITSLSEQKIIVDYLDKQTAKIDATIAKNEELNQLLEEKRVALINKVVTKGLNPDVSMKDSGVEWIGEIPEHWDVTPLKRFVKLHNGKEINNEVKEDDEDAIGVYGSGGLFKYTDEYLFKGESVLFGRKGTLGKPLYLNDIFWTVDTMYYLSFNKYLLPKYCYYYLTFYPWNKISTETAKPSVVGSDVTNSMFAIPDIVEQKQIADYLDTEITKLNQTVNKIQENINLLEEYKTSLIHHVVTGKIDVREEVI